MKTDRELLELAAKAFWGDEIDDVSIRWGEQDNAILYIHADNQDHNGQDREFVWDPLTDDGDALRLAVKLSIDVLNSSPILAQAVQHQTGAYGEALKYDDHYAATRRAIVMAAAELGE